MSSLKQNLLQKQKSASFQFLKPNFKSNSYHKIQSFEMQDLKLKNLLEIQGQCRITTLKFIRLHYLKIIFLLIPVIISVVGIWFLKYSKSFRVMVLYVEQSDPQNATHVFITGNDGEYQQIQNIERYPSSLRFFFKKLKYEIIGDKAYPFALKYWEQFDKLFISKHINNGLDTQKIQQIEQKFGKNSHLVDTPSYIWYMIDIMTKPFFLIQYMICIMFILQKITVFAVLLFGSTFITTSINYILLYVSFLKIKEIAESKYSIRVIRSGKQITIQSDELLPGDIYFLTKEQIIPCDSILVSGQAYVNQASLTGESVPVGKFKIQKSNQLDENNRWLFQGSTILDCRNQAKAIAINTGYRSRRGRIIRKISNRVPAEPQMFRFAIYFLLQSLAIGIIVYCVTLPVLLSANITPQFRIYRFLDFIGFSFPPTFPIYFNLSYSFALARLRKKDVYGTEPQKTVEGGFLKTICFDKTGTLTQNKLQIQNIYKFKDQKFETITQKQFKNQKKDSLSQKMLQIFSACHSVKKIDDRYLGDEVDLKMFEATNNSIQIPYDSNIKFSIVSNETKIDILKINQFESRYQHMAVLIFNHKTKKYSLLMKGAPQKIHSCSLQQYDYFEGLLKRISLNGYRSIGIAYRQIQQNQVQSYLSGQIPRNLLDSERKKDFTMIGLVTFENKLKEDTQQTIIKLTQSCIQTKVITGDNLFIAIETASRAGLLPKKFTDNKIIIIEGKAQQQKQQQSINGSRTFKAKLLYFESKTSQNDSELVLQKEEDISLTESDTYINQPYPIAVDNDFLKLQPTPELTNKIKIFARISPQNKAFIVKQLKALMNDEYEQMTKLQKIMVSRPKIGMAGDGANDLMALKQADVGFGLSDTDASYGSCFSIKNLSNIEQTIRQSKSTSTTILQCLRYYGTISFLKIICSMLMMTQSTYFSSSQLSYFNFTSTLIIPIAIALGRPSSQNSPLKPIVNMLSIKNHLIYWGNIVIPSLSIICGYFYFRNRNDFIPNPVPRLTPDGFYTLCQSTTVVWLLVQAPFALNGFFVYNNGHKFKQPFYKNYILLALILLNFVADIYYFFNPQSVAKALDLVAIPKQSSGVLVTITVAFAIISVIYAKCIDCMDFQQKAFNFSNPTANLQSNMNQSNNRIKNASLNLNLTENFELSQPNQIIQK